MSILEAVESGKDGVFCVARVNGVAVQAGSLFTAELGDLQTMDAFYQMGRAMIRQLDKQGAFEEKTDDKNKNEE